ncbi:hypothetical protein E1301_Tti002234 [Triplophysa tibetana]|uniref:Uncharacterized protein n=1 Tax=Triplophysa tibetana TaxID=1572043 RepID=A0A5A9NAB4_9TELE|nr:hypothetical protein E1301_Tti002234 [Triplophysa tibetana]
MTTVNAPCSLLARNEFYRNINPTDPKKAVNSFSDTLVEPKQRQVTVWVTVSKHQGTVHKFSKQMFCQLNNLQLSKLAEQNIHS